MEFVKQSWSRQLCLYRCSHELSMQEFLVHEKKYLKVKGFYPDHNEPLPERIVEINKKLLNSSQKNYSVINLHKHFIDESNDVKGFLFKDGVHLNEEGYELWTKILEKYIYQFEKKATE